MKYFYEKPEYWHNVGIIYSCDHPMFNRCTLFLKDNKGIAIIQEHFNDRIKARWWGSLDPWLAYDIYKNEGFGEFFERESQKIDSFGLYPVFQVRKVMWALKMKPLRKEFWEDF